MATNGNYTYGPAPVDAGTTSTTPVGPLDRGPAAVPPGAGTGTVVPTNNTPVVPQVELPVDPVEAGLGTGTSTTQVVPQVELPVDTAGANVVAGPNVSAPAQQRYITVLANGVVIANNVSTLNFLGNGVTVSNNGTTGANITITSSGGGGGNANLGNWAFVANTQYNLNGGAINNSDLTHGATASLTLPANGNTTAISLLNYYGNIAVIAAASPSATKTWTFDKSGNLTLPTNTSSINYANGQPYANLGNLSIDDNNIYNTNGQGVVISNFSFIAEAETAYVQIPAGNSTNDLNVVQEQGNVRIAANASAWSFNTNGITILPDNTNMGTIEGANTFGFYNNNANTDFLIELGPTNAWSFNGATGNLTFPDNSGSSWPINQQRFGMGNIGAWLDGQWTIGEFSGNGVSGQVGIRIDPGIEGNTGVTIPSQADSTTQPVSMYNTGGGGINLYTGANNWSFTSTGQTILPVLTTVRGDTRTGTISGYTLNIGDGGQEAVISTPNAGTGQYNSQRLVINPGAGEPGTSGEGGDIYLWAGRGGDTNGNGGDVKIRGGYGPGDGQGGYIRIEAGDVQGSGTPGYIYHRGGDVNVGTGGYVQSQGGQGTTGGYISLTGGYGTDGPGGAVTITGGQAAGGLPYYGNVGINAGASSWAFDNTGTLTFPSLANISGGNFNAGTASATVALNAFSPDGNTVSIQAQGNTSSAVISIFSNAGPVTSNWTFTTAPLDPSESFLYIPNGGAISTPDATGGQGGKNIFIQAGASDPVTWNSNPGGDLMLKGGYGSFGDGGGGPGGDVNIEGGPSSDSHAGNVNINSALNTWVFDYTGNLSLPPSSNIVGVTDNNNGHLNWVGNSSGDGAGYTTLRLIPDDTRESADQYLIIDPTAPGHIHIRAGGTQDNSNADLFLGGENSYFKIAAGSNSQATISSNSNAWVFNTDGNLQVPGNINGDNSAPLVIDGASSGEGFIRLPSASFGGEQVAIVNQFSLGNGIALTTGGGTWHFGNTGSITFPDATVQSTAYTGATYGNANVVANLAALGSNPVSTTGNITGGYILGNGSQLTGLPATYGNANVVANLAALGSNPISTTGNITGGNLSVVGSIVANNITGYGNIIFNQTLSTQGGSDMSLIPGTGLTRSYGNFRPYFANTYDLGGSTTRWNNIYANVTNSVTHTVTGNITGGNINTAGVVSATGAVTGQTLVSTLSTVNEGGEITLALPSSGSTLSTSITIDSYQDRLRFFETGGSTRGMFIDLANMGNITANAAQIGYINIPQVSFSANATAALSDSGKHYYSTTAGNLALTLPDNSNVAFATGTTLTIVVNAAGNVLVNQGTGVSLYMAGSSTTGNRAVGAYGLASVMKVAANTWVISGTGVY